jgi:hypothetical protein
VSDVSSPLWLLITTALASFLGALVGHWWTRKSARELDTWRHREETMRMVRWAAGQAGSPDPRTANIGYVALTALLGSELLQDEDVAFISAIAEAGVDSAVEDVERYRGDAQVAVDFDDDDAWNGEV